MRTEDYMLYIERHSHHDRDDWGVESDSYTCYDADITGQQVDNDRLTFRVHFLENYRGAEITVGSDSPACAGGSTDRSSGSYTVSLISKDQFTPQEGYIHYQ